MGNQGTLGEVCFDGVRVGEDALIGLEGQGLLLQIRRLAHERAFVAVILVAMADTSLRALIARCHELVAFGESLAASGAVQFRLAELRADIEAARCLAYHAIATVISGQDARGPAAMAKLVASQAFRKVTDEALQLSGASAYAEDSPTSQAYRDSLGFAFAGGTDHMLLETIAR